MKRVYQNTAILILVVFLITACGSSIPSKNDAMTPIAERQAATQYAETSQFQADAIADAASLEADAIADAASLEATAIADAAQTEATAIIEGAQIEATAVTQAAKAEAEAMAALVAMETGEEPEATTVEAVVSESFEEEHISAEEGSVGEDRVDENKAAIRAVDLIGTWADAGASETEPFSYVGRDGNSYDATYKIDIVPLFTTNGLWFEGSQACTGCHFANSENSFHEMDLSTYEGIMAGGDVLSEPPGVPLFGQSEVGADDFNWSHSKLRGRLRNNRMPPGWEFDITETNRNGPCLEISDKGVAAMIGEYGCDLNAVGLIGAWVEAGVPETESFEYGEAALNFERDILPFFVTNNMWFEGSQACTGCHFANSENSYHEMNLGTYEGLMLGGDVLSEPPGVPLFGQSEVGADDYDWGHSKLRGRLRNNRMSPGWEFDITEENRDGPWVLHGERVEMGMESESESESGISIGGDCAVRAVDLIGAWANASASESDPFEFTADDGTVCKGNFEADIFPLFTQNNLWFEGAQACIGCHFANSENSFHEMDLNSYEGIIAGADVLSEPPGVPLFGQSEVGADDFDWSHSKIRERLRNNRMPPGWEFDITETNRNGLCVDLSADGAQTVQFEYGCELNTLGLIGAWVDAGASETETFEYGEASLNFERDILPLFTQDNMWFEGSQACTGCHFSNSENSYHEMDLSSYEGIMLGGDVLSEPPGVPILGQSEVGATDYDWSHSKLRGRLRNNRMAPGVEFDITEENRDGPMVLAGQPK